MATPEDVSRHMSMDCLIGCAKIGRLLASYDESVRRESMVRAASESDNPIAALVNAKRELGLHVSDEMMDLQSDPIRQAEAITIARVLASQLSANGQNAIINAALVGGGCNYGPISSESGSDCTSTGAYIVDVHRPDN